jgi:hypothetical protein
MEIAGMKGRTTACWLAKVTRRVIVANGIAVLILYSPLSLRADDLNVWDPEHKPLSRIPVGTSFGEQPPEGWSNIILFVDGKLGSGDVSAASSTVHYYAKLFNPVILANVTKGADNQYRLDKVAVGFSMKVQGKNTVLTARTQRQVGANLSLVGRSVLLGNESALSDMKQVARYKTSMVFDIPTIMLHNGDHRKMIVRYLVWVSPSNGRVGTAAWLLDDQPGSANYRVVEDAIQLLPPHMREKRIMNVKGDRFTLGIPAPDAFAVVRIPQGTPVAVTERLRASAGRRSFTLDTFRELLGSVNEAVALQRAAGGTLSSS